ncbi:MAG: hypothetical protein AB2535_15690 [Candidatus Thiodiazotropha endolucinida]
MIPGTDIRRVLTWQPDSEGDSFTIRTFSNTLSYPDGKKYPKAMPTAEQWTGTMRRLGIDQNDTVIVVGNGAWYQSADAISEVLNSHFGHPGRQEDIRHVIVCDSEGLSNIVMWVARSLGYENVFVLAGRLHEFTMYGDNHRYVNLTNNVD